MLEFMSELLLSANSEVQKLIELVFELPKSEEYSESSSDPDPD